MKVKELIEFLSKYPPDMDVTFLDDNNYPYAIPQEIYSIDQRTVSTCDKNEDHLEIGSTGRPKSKRCSIYPETYYYTKKVVVISN